MVKAYPDEIEKPDINVFKEEVAKNRDFLLENNIKVIDNSINSIKNYLLIFCALIIVIGGAYVYLVYEGYLEDNFSNNNNFTINNPPVMVKNDLSSPIVNVNVKVYPLMNRTDVYYNSTDIYYLNNSAVNFTE